MTTSILSAEGALRACFVRSIMAHGRALGIDLREAAMRGDRGVKVTAVIVALGSLMVGCTGADRVTSTLTRSPSVSAASSLPATTAVVDPAIAIETPFANGEVGTPVSITGTADVVDGTLAVRVLDQDGNELAAVAVETSCGDRCLGSFSTELSFFVERSGPGTIEVTGVGEDGDPALASVPVVLFPP